MAQIVKRTARGEPRYDVRLRIDGRVVTKTFRRRKDAEAWAATIQARRFAGTAVDPAGGRTTVTELADLWLRSNPGKRESTLASDRSAVDVHIVPSIGSRRIGTVRQPDVQGLVNQWAAVLAPNTVARVYGVLRAMFTYAVNADLLSRSPCRHVNLPKGGLRVPRFLTNDEVAAIASAIDERYRLMVWIAAMLGLRWGEVAGLKVRSVDLLAGRLVVAEALSRDGRGRSRVGLPKSRASTRAIALPRALISAIAAHLAASGLSAADADTYLFESRSGPLDYSHFRQRVWLPAVTKASLPGVGFHDLRRTNASVMVAERVDVKTAQTRLGHADVRTTLQLYALATSIADRLAADILDRRFAAALQRDALSPVATQAALSSKLSSKPCQASPPRDERAMGAQIKKRRSGPLGP